MQPSSWRRNRLTMHQGDLRRRIQRCTTGAIEVLEKSTAPGRKDAATESRTP